VASLYNDILFFRQVAFIILENIRFTTSTQQVHNTPSREGETQCVEENVRFTTPIQQLYNNLSHEDESHILGPPSCEGLLYSCCIGVVQESNPMCGAHPYVRECCALVVMV
jgi:hypothetical protein